jgi:hypothetical protein
MLKIFSFGKNQAGIWITFLALILLGSYYFFSYIPEHEQMVQERRFRGLRKIDRSIYQKIETSKILITNLARDYYNFAAKRKEKDLVALEHYIQSNSKKNFTLLLPDQSLRYYESPNLKYIGDNIEGDKFYMESSSRITLLIKKATGDKNIPIKDSDDKKALDIRLMGIQFGFDQFIKPLLLSDVFDYYAIFINREKIYEDYPLGLNFSDPDSLLNVKSKVSTPGLRSLRIGETDYKVFSQPVYTATGNKWIISGLLKSENYQQEKNQLPSWVLLLLFTVVIVIVVSLPWIKLYHMGNKDKVTINDGIASVLVSIFLMSLLFFVFFKYIIDVKQSHWADVGNASYAGDNYSRNELASKISQAFLAEIDTACHLMDVFKTVLKDGDADITLLGKRNNRVDKLFNKERHALDVNEIYWLDKNGWEKTNFTTDSLTAPKGQYESRDYFRSPAAYKIGDHSFGFEYVLSYTNGSFRSIFSERADTNGSVIALSCNLKSVNNVTLPEGYQFAIISSGGWVVYHSKPNRSLIDDLQKEFTNRKDLISSLSARSDTSFKTTYYGKTYNIRIKPVPNQQFFTVVFEDSEYNDSRDTEAYTFTLSMLICMLVFIIINYLIVFMISAKRSIFRKQHFDTSWIGPHLSCHHQYNNAIIGNLIIITLLIIFFNHSSFLTYFYILLVSVIFTSLYLNIAFAIKYRYTDPVAYQRKVFGNITLIGLTAFISFLAIYNLEHWLSFALFEGALVLFCGTILWFAKYRHLNLFLINTRRLFKWDYAHSYALMVTTRLIITSGVPVAFFFMYSFNYEQILNTRYKQMNFASVLAKKLKVNYNNNPAYKACEDSIKTQQANYAEIKAKILLSQKVGKRGPTVMSIAQEQDKLNKQLIKIHHNITLTKNNAFKIQINEYNKKLDSLKKNKVYNSGMYTDGFFVDDLSVHAANNINNILDTLKTRTREDMVTADILNTFRLLLNETEIKNDHLNLPTSGKAVFTSPYPRLGNNSPVETYYRLDLLKYLQIRSIASITYPQPHIVFWFLLGVAMFFFHFIINNIIRRLFSLNLYSTTVWRQMDDELMEHSYFNKMVFIVGSPGSHSLEKLMVKINTRKIKHDNGTPLNLTEVNAGVNSAFIADMMILPSEPNKVDPQWERHKKAASAGHGLVIIDHFEYNIKDSEVNKIKLDFLEMLMEKKESKVIIISTMHPLIFLDSFSEQQQGTTTDSELGRWHALLGKFHVVIDPLVASATQPRADFYEQTIINETQYSRFLHRMQKTSLNFLVADINSPGTDSKNNITDSMVFKLQLTSQYFYTDIWQSLTLEEKFLLYDLAEDGLVNSYDNFNLSMLICKGLIINKDGVLNLFNVGFRNFILTAVGAKEVNRIRDKVKDNSRWSNLKIPLNLTIMTILVFLFASQQEEYTRVITYITAFGAGVPAILKIFSLFGSSSTQKAE